MHVWLAERELRVRWCARGGGNFAEFFEEQSSAFHMLVEVLVAKGCGVQLCAVSVRAKSAQDPNMQERHVLQWSYRYGAALDILHLLDSSAANNACPPPHPKRPFPSRGCIPVRGVVYRVRAHTGLQYRKSVAHSLSRSQACSYTSSNAAQHCKSAGDILTGPWLLVSDCRSARSWSQSNISSWPGVDTNSKAGGATHGRFRAWQEHFRQFAW